MAASTDNADGKEAFKAGRFAEAVAAFSRAHAEFPADAQVLGNRSAAYAKLGQHSEALADAQAAVSADFSYVKGYYRQASSLIALGRFADAAQAASAGLALQPNNAQMTEMRAEALRRQGVAPRQATPSDDDDEMASGEEGESEAESAEEDGGMQVEPAGPLLSPEELQAESKAKSEASKANGNAHFKAGRWAEAAAQYQLAMAADPSNATFPCNRAAALLHLGKAADALADAQVALVLDPSLLKAHVRAAKAMCQLGRFSEARRQLEGAATLEGAAVGPELAALDGLEALLRNGKAALARPEPSSAREAAVTLSSLAEKCPASVDFACLQMEAVLKARPVQGAAQVLSESARWLRANTDNPDLLVVRGKALYGTGQLEQALKHCSEALRLDPDHTPAREMRSRIKELDALKAGGNAAFSSAQYDEAIRLYTAAIDFDPNLVDLLPTLYTNRATAKSKKGEFESAIADCNLALASNPRHLKALLRRAACKMEMEAYQQAIDDYQAAQELEPNDRAIAQSLRHAKVELKKSLRKDLYKIIGVTKRATEVEIKKAYKKMALAWHPDRHSAGSEAEREEAEKRFKEIGEAFEILSDPAKKNKYDEGMDVEEINGGGGGRGHAHHGMDPMDIFAQMGGMGGMGGGFDFGGGMPHGYARRGGGR